MSELQDVNKNMPSYTLTTLNRWSIANKRLPDIDKIKSLHVYDFDNTLFNTPSPNTKLWNGPTIGFLQSQDTFSTGGWWHNSRLLAATGEGIENEEPRAWQGWWNECIVELVQLSMQQKDALTILLTGRSENGFSGLVKRIVKSKKLDFDIISLKPFIGPNNERFSNTMNFKKTFLEYLVETYKKADNIRIYEDRIKHTRAFREFFMEYNKAQQAKPTRGTIMAEVIQVADGPTQLNPVVEIAEVQRLINDHNLAIKQGKCEKPLQIKKMVSYTGYLIGNDDTQKLLKLVQIPPTMSDNEIRFLANNVLIVPRPSPSSILEKVGGMGNKVTWEVTGTAVFENKIWAACVRPVTQSQRYYTESAIPMVVLALRKGARLNDAGKIQNWQPVPADKQYIFSSVVGEKVLLRIEQKDSRENEYESQSQSKTLKRKHAADDDTPVRERNHTYGNNTPINKNGNQQNHGSGRSFRGSSRTSTQRGYRSGGNNRAGRGRSRGGGSTYIYRSLDDVDKNNTTTGYNAAVAYEDLPRLQKQYQTPQKFVHQQF